MRRVWGLLVVVFSVLLEPGIDGGSASAQEHRAPRVYKTTIAANWDKAERRLWYRNDLADGAREFIVVDAHKGTREPAFDHARVAKALSASLKAEIDAARLPIDGIEFGETPETWRIQSRRKAWNLNLTDYSLTDAAPGKPVSLPTNLPLRASARTGAETSITFINQLKEEVELLWLEPGGARKTYGKLAAGAERDQHTFAGHRWLVTRLDGTPVAVVQATDGPGLALIDGQSPPIPRERRPDRSDARGQGQMPRAVASPNGQYEAFVRDHNVWIRETGTGNEWGLSDDGTVENSFHRDSVRSRAVEMNYSAPDWPDSYPEVYWSPSGAHVLAIQTLAVPEPKVFVVESSPRDQTQPKLHSYPYIKPGDPIPLRQLRLFEVAGREISIDHSLFKNPWSLDSFSWDKDGSRFRFVYNERGHQTLRVLSVETQTGRVQLLVNETSPTFIDYSGKFFYDYVDDSQEIIWRSERDGWSHLYLCDGRLGGIKNQITRGDWTIRSVDRVDSSLRQITFTASGINPGEDPYYVHTGRINFDGTGLTWLTNGDGTHQIQWSPTRQFLIDTWSRVDLPPTHVLRNADDGATIVELEKGDATELTAAGIELPSRFVAKGRDQTTDIYGIIHWPRDKDRNQKYPIVEMIYAGPHSNHVPKAFQAYWRVRDLTDRGFVVVQIDGMGTSNRSKAFHDVCWKNLADAGFPDRILWMQAAAQQFPELDISRVGIFGGSAGGQNALGALLWHGDFYRVAVADCGCHDNRMDKIWWNEQWMGYPLGQHYVEQSNVTQAHRLKGKLLLVVGELDRNVDPASTMQVVDALIRANKDFEFLPIPGADHGAAESPYGSRRRLEFLVRYLNPPTEGRRVKDEG